MTLNVFEKQLEESLASMERIQSNCERNRNEFEKKIEAKDISITDIE